jgi:uncharacterized protein (DUF302 family)
MSALPVAYGATLTLRRGFDDVVTDVRAALADQGFGVLTEIDVRATMKAKLGIDVPAQVILGACNPPLAHRAMDAEPSLGLLLPCNVVVRQTDEGTIVQAIDPDVLVRYTDNPALEPIAREVGDKLLAALAAVAEAAEGPR